ncbi:MAG: phosphoglycerate mutase, partial [Clostridiales bacterium]|nr:phosphoglycerate mutase [Clostridiales bacterium]
MKYVVLLCDGMADYPLEELGGKTPMQAAAKPYMDSLAKRGTVGLVKTVADGLTPGSDVANLSVMGYDPLVCYTGRSPLEAASMGISLSDTDLALRCNLVTLSDEPDYADKTMVDYCAGDISSEEAAVLIQAVQDAIGSSDFSFYPGVSYRHCLVWHGCGDDLGTLTPPHDISGRVVGPYLTQNERAAVL